MRNEKIFNAIGNLSDDLIADAAIRVDKRKAKVRHFRWKPLAAACLAIIMLALPVSAEMVDGYVSNLLAPLFGGAQTEIVDKIGVPIGASTSVSGYTLTVDAIIGDRYSVMIAYTLSRDDGQPIPENIDFEIREIRASGYSTRIEIDEENPSVAHFHERWCRNEPLMGRIVTPSFSNLITDRGKETETVIAEGTWEITFTIRYPDTSEKIPVRNLDVYDENGKKYRVKEIILSYMGVHMELIEYDPVFAAASYTGFQTALLLKDGTEIPIEGGGGGGMKKGDKTRKFSYYGRFDIPIPREDIQAIIICGTTCELNEGN